MTLQELRDQTRWYTRTDTTTYPNTDLDRELNNAYREVVIDILRAQGYRNLFGRQATQDFLDASALTEGDNGYQGQYKFPSDLLKPHRMEVKYSSSSSPVQVTLYDISENNDFSESDSDELNSMASEEYPVVRFDNDTFYIRPFNTETTVTDGIRIWYEYRQTELSLTTDIPAIEESFHTLLAAKAASALFVRYPERFNRRVPELISELQRKMGNFYRARMSQKKVLREQVESFK